MTSPSGNVSASILPLANSLAVRNSSGNLYAMQFIGTTASGAPTVLGDTFQNLTPGGILTLRTDTTAGIVIPEDSLTVRVIQGPSTGFKNMVLSSFEDLAISGARNLDLTAAAEVFVSSGTGFPINLNGATLSSTGDLASTSVTAPTVTCTGNLYSSSFIANNSWMYQFLTTPTTWTISTPPTITANMIAGGVLYCPVGSNSYTFDSAASIVSLAGSNGNTAFVGQTLSMLHVNGVAGASTYSGAAGITLNLAINSIAAKSSKMLYFVITNVVTPAVTIYG